MWFWTGIGSRDISIEEEDIIFDLAYHLAAMDGVLRTGCASGSDERFEDGYAEAYSDGLTFRSPELYIPWNNFMPNIQRPWKRNRAHPGALGDAWNDAMRLVAEIHPAHNRLSQGAYKLHARNMFQPLGYFLDKPSKFLLACSDSDKYGDPKGGTRTAWMLAKRYDIPCFNIRGRDMDEALDFIESVVFNNRDYMPRLW